MAQYIARGGPRQTLLAMPNFEALAKGRGTAMANFLPFPCVSGYGGEPLKIEYSSEFIEEAR